MADTTDKSVSEADRLRQRAEDSLRTEQSEQPHSRTTEEAQRLVHELEVHQIELEMQNAALSQSRDETEAALEKYTDLCDFSPAGYFTLDRSGVIRASNLTGSSFLGIERSGLIGQPFALFVAAESRPTLSLFLEQLFTTPGKTSCELALTRKGDSPIIVQLAAVSAESGQECRVAVIDITRRKQAEQSLLINEKIYRAIGESIDYGIWICTPDGRNIYASQSFLDLVGMTQEQCSDFGWGDILHPDDAEQTIAAWKECVRTGGTWDIEHRYRGVDGQWHDILARGLPVRNEQGEIIYWSGINLDISQLKKTEKALRHSEERLRLFIEYAPAALAMFDNEMRYMYVSNRWLSDYGLTGSYLCGLSHYDVFPEITAEWREVHRRALSGEVISKDEDLFVRADGSEQCLRWEVRPWFLYDGTVGGIVIFTEDITARKATENALRESEERFRAIASASSDWIWEIDSDGRYTYASDNVMQALGYRPAEIIGRTPFDLMPPAEAELVRKEFHAILDRHGTFHDLPNINLHRNGETRHVLTTGLPIFDRQGALIGYRGVDKDITERKLFEDNLRQSEERHRVLAETMLQGVVHKDTTGRIIDMNPAAERILGKSREDFLGNNSATVEQDTFRENGETFPGAEHPTMVALRTGLPVRGLVMGVFNPRLNQLRWLSIDAVPVFSPGEDFPSEVYSVFEDITERKQSEQQLQKYVEDLQSLNDELGRFNSLAVGRELRMIELKKEINELCIQTGQSPRYMLDFEDE